MKTFLPEWTECEGVLLALPHEDTDWNYILPEALDQYKRLTQAFVKEDIRVFILCKDPESAANLFPQEDLGKISFIESDFNDTWTRDYGPLTIIQDNELKALNFGFNGWGLKFAADKDNLINLHLNKIGLFKPGSYENESDFILEGGSIETDGNGTILTTSRCLCSPNRNGGLSKKEAADQLKERLGAKTVHFLDHGALIGDDTDSHIDTLARMAPGNSILFTGCREKEDPQYEGLLNMRYQLSELRNPDGMPYNLVELPLPSPIMDEEGERLPATYANYLILNDVIFMPTYGQPDKDMLAMDTLKIVFPAYKIVGVECLILIKQHGSLHCATMQIPEGLLTD